MTNKENKKTICPDCGGSGAIMAHVCGGNDRVCYRLCPEVEPCERCRTEGFITEKEYEDYKKSLTIEEVKDSDLPF